MTGKAVVTVTTKKSKSTFLLEKSLEMIHVLSELFADIFFVGQVMDLLTNHFSSYSD